MEPLAVENEKLRAGLRAIYDVAVEWCEESGDERFSEIAGLAMLEHVLHGGPPQAAAR